VVEGYRDVFSWGIKMSSPSVLNEVIGNAAAYARKEEKEAFDKGEQSYTILLLLTDGAFDYEDEAKVAIQEASNSPLSIILLGIGDKDFSLMQYLDDFMDADDTQYRDVTQFVECRKYENDESQLTSAIFEEIPDQLVDYFYGKGIMPNPPIVMDEEEDGNKDEEVNDASTTDYSNSISGLMSLLNCKCSKC